MENFYCSSYIKQDANFNNRLISVLQPQAGGDFRLSTLALEKLKSYIAKTSVDEIEKTRIFLNCIYQRMSIYIYQQDLITESHVFLMNNCEMNRKPGIYFSILMDACPI